MKKDQQEDSDYKMPQSHDIHYENQEKQENNNKGSSNSMSQEANEKRKKLQEEIKKLSQTQEKEAESFNNKAKKENLEELRRRLVEKTQEKRTHLPVIFLILELLQKKWTGGECLQTL